MTRNSQASGESAQNRENRLRLLLGLGVQLPNDDLRFLSERIINSLPYELQRQALEIIRALAEKEAQENRDRRRMQ